MKVARLKYTHSEPLFRYSGLNPVSASNNESIKLVLEGEVDVAFVPLTYAAQYCDVLGMIPHYAIYSRGPVYRPGYSRAWVRVMLRLRIQALMQVP